MHVGRQEWTLSWGDSRLPAVAGTARPEFDTLYSVLVEQLKCWPSQRTACLAQNGASLSECAIQEKSSPERRHSQRHLHDNT